MRFVVQRTRENFQALTKGIVAEAIEAGGGARRVDQFLISPNHFALVDARN